MTGRLKSGADPLSELSRHLEYERRRAVDAEELAAYLEADGFSDEILRDKYGMPGLFATAQAIYSQAGGGSALNTPAKLSRPAFPYATLLRGGLYILPGVSGALLSQQWSSALPAFIFASAFGWGWTMLIAALRYAEPLAVPGRALRLALAVGAALGTVGSGLVSAQLHGWAAASSGAVLGGVISLSLCSAGVLLALGRVRLHCAAFALPLLLAASPVVLGNVWEHLTVTALLVLAAVPTLGALHATRRPGQLPATWQTLWRFVPSAVYGWSMAAAFVALTGRTGAWSVLPLILSSGLLEALVWHAQALLQHFAATSRARLRLQRRGWPTVLGSAASYGAALAALLVIVSLGQNDINLRDVPTVACFGAALLLSAWLYNQRQTRWLSGMWAAAAALLHWTTWPTGPLMWVALLGLVLSTLHLLSDPRSYR